MSAPSPPNTIRAARAPRSAAASAPARAKNGRAAKGVNKSSAAETSPRPAQAQAADLAIGERVRVLRRERGLLLADMAQRMEVSIGYLSQIERGLSSPSLRVLVSLAETLGAPLASLFTATAAAASEDESTVVTRAAARSELSVWRSGVTKQLLTPRGDGALSVFLVELAPGADSGAELYAHAGEEAGFVLDGALSLTVEGETWALKRGDGFRFRSLRPHRFANPSRKSARVLWINVNAQAAPRESDT